MDGLVHQRSAAVKFPRAVPGVLVIFIGTPPGNIYAGVCNHTETSGVYRFSKRHHHIVKSVRKYAAQTSTAFFVGLGHSVNSLQGNIQGLFAYYVFSGLGCGNGRLLMESARRGDSNNIYLVTFEHFLIVVEGADVEFICKAFSSLGYLIATAD